VCWPPSWLWHATGQCYLAWVYGIPHEASKIYERSEYKMANSVQSQLAGTELVHDRDIASHLAYLGATRAV